MNFTPIPGNDTADPAFLRFATPVPPPEGAGPPDGAGDFLVISVPAEGTGCVLPADAPLRVPLRQPPSEGRLSRAQRAAGAILTEGEESIAIWPNPSGGAVSFSFGATAPDGIFICSKEGTPLLSVPVHEGRKQYVCDFSGLEKGMYLVHFRFGTRNIVRQLLLR